MKKISINGKYGVSDIIIGDYSSLLLKYIPKENVFIITDKNVAAYCKGKFPPYPVFEIEPGEKSKDFSVMAELYHWLLDYGADRNSFIIGIGGGVVCDLAGFVAATFMRGIRFGFVATSLLAQVDASVGGKNGVNLGGYKNIVGTFTQPEFVICDINTLKTLPNEEFTNGMAEVIKHALIRDLSKFDFLEKSKDLVLALDNASINYIVSSSVNIKATIVQADEREKGERRLLNFGHTWGHAIEKVIGIPHGQAVSIGMAFATDFSVYKGWLTAEEKDRVKNVLEMYNLPVIAKYDKIKVFEALLKDKKKGQRTINFVFLERIGKAFTKQIGVDELESFVFNLCSN